MALVAHYSAELWRTNY